MCSVKLDRGMVNIVSVARCNKVGINYDLAHPQF